MLCTLSDKNKTAEKSLDFRKNSDILGYSQQNIYGRDFSSIKLNSNLLPTPSPMFSRVLVGNFTSYCSIVHIATFGWVLLNFSEIEK